MSKSPFNALMTPLPFAPFGGHQFPTAFSRFVEPEVPEAERRAVAWANLPDGPMPGWKYSEGQAIFEWEFGNRNSPFGWEIDHITPVVFGGRSTRSNLIARAWQSNASAGGRIGAMMNALIDRR
jgi:hypothetical protein